MPPTRRTPRTRPPRAFTMIEILISLVIVGVIAGALTSLLTQQNRYFDQQTNVRRAREIARSSMNVLLSDLRMVQDSGGVDSVASDGKMIRVIVPYRFGLVCSTSGTRTTVSLVPADSATVALSTYAGFAWRDSTTGRYHVITPSTPTGAEIPVASSHTSDCTGSGSGQANIRTISMNGRAGTLLDLTSDAASGAYPPVPVFLWEKISYSFKASVVFPGKIALWRNVQGGTNEEIMAPFDTSARFKFYETGDDTSRTTPPSVALIRGVDVVLNAISPKVSANTDSTSKENLVTSIFFKNTRTY